MISYTFQYSCEDRLSSIRASRRPLPRPQTNSNAMPGPNSKIPATWVRPLGSERGLRPAITVKARTHAPRDHRSATSVSFNYRIYLYVNTMLLICLIYSLLRSTERFLRFTFNKRTADGDCDGERGPRQPCNRLTVPRCARANFILFQLTLIIGIEVPSSRIG